MMTNSLLVVCFLLSAGHHCFTWPVKINSNLAKSQHFELSTVENAIDTKEELGERYNKFFNTKESRHGSTEDRSAKWQGREDEMEDLKKHWLNLLGLQQEPAGRTSPVPAFMKAVYSVYDSDTKVIQQSQPSRISDEEDRTIRALLPQRDSGSARLNWTFSYIRPDEVLDQYTHAELVLHLRMNPTEKACETLPSGSVLQVSTSVSEWTEVYGIRRNIKGVPECWDAFDLSRMFDLWRLETEVSQSSSIYVSLQIPENESMLYDLYGFDELYEPLLVLYTHDPAEMEVIQTETGGGFYYPGINYDDDGGFRAKRSIADEGPNTYDTVENSKREPCSLKAWYVTFEELGWGDWIVTPRGVNANYCEGGCTIDRNMTNHAFIKKVYRERYSQYDLPEASCVPTRIHPMSILFSTNGTILLKKMPEMKAEACGCL